jgi:hypothetical protein
VRLMASEAASHDSRVAQKGRQDKARQGRAGRRKWVSWKMVRTVVFPADCLSPKTGQQGLCRDAVRGTSALGAID